MIELIKREQMALLDLITLEKNLMAKSVWYASLVEDRELREQFQKLAGKHQHHINLLCKEVVGCEYEG